MRRFLCTVVVFWFALMGVAKADSCAADNTDSDIDLHQAEATSLEFQFDSGASWTLCWHIDEHAGLVLSRVFYAAPSSEPRQVLDALSIGQILFKYDEDTQTDYLLSEPGLGASLYQNTINPVDQCDGGQWIAGVDGYQICQRYQQVNHMTCLLYTSPSPRDRG